MSLFFFTGFSFKQEGAIYLSFVKRFKEYIIKSSSDDRNPLVYVLGGCVSHVTIDVLRYSRTNNSIDIFQLTSHSSFTYGAAPGCLRLQNLLGSAEVTELLITFPLKNRKRMPLKSDMANITRDSWETVSALVGE